MRPSPQETETGNFTNYTATVIMSDLLERL